MRSKKIAITNEKGGCAKTTTAVNLSATLAEKGYKTLLVDMDYQSYASHYLDRYNEDNPGIFEVLKGYDIRAVVQSTDFNNLFILPATISFISGEEWLISEKNNGSGYLSIVENALSPISEDYDYIIIDCPPNGIFLKEAIQKYADFLVLPTVPDDYAVHSLLCKASEMMKIKASVNPHLEILGILIVMFEKNRNKIAYTNALKEQEMFPCFDTVIRKNTTLSEAINAKLPIVHYNKRSNGAVDYKAFTDEIISKTQGGK